jgi:uncharacterized membrane protein YjjP (DUF1212 family)
MTGAAPMGDDFDARVAFLAELARRLHNAGVSSQRLEGAVRSTARALHVECEVWSTPTGLLLSLADADVPHATQQTRVLRLEPGHIDLSALVALNRIGDEVIAGTRSVVAAREAMRALDRPATPARRLRTVAAFGVASAAVAALFGGAWLDLGVAFLLGLVIGGIALLSADRPDLAAANEAVSALVATTAATAFGHFVAPIAVQTVVIAALIVLMPGLMLTTAVTELATQQLSSGSARAAGALTVLLKLTFGSVAATQALAALGWAVPTPAPVAMPVGINWAAAVLAAASFAALFNAARRDVALVMGSALAGYLITRVTGPWFAAGSTTFAGGVFCASLCIAALANVYGRVSGRPGSLVRLPGIMLLVPGSVGFRAFGFVMVRDYALGVDTLLAVLGALLALTAGLLFGALLVPPRRHL